MSFSYIFPTFFNLVVDSLRHFTFYCTYKKLSRYEKLKKPSYFWLDMGGHSGQNGKATPDAVCSG